MSKNIVVTGGAGAVGTNLIKRLVEEGHRVTSWDNYSVGKAENHIAGAWYKPIDTILSEDAMTDDIDLVYHLGEYSKIVPSFDEISKVYQYNVAGSFRLLEACRKFNVPIVYAGSSTKLSYPGELHSPYAFFKSTVAKMFQGYGDWYGLKYNICYFYNVYGPGTDLWGNEWQSVINIFIDQKQKNIPLTICGDGTQLRDYTHVYDIVDGLVLAGENIRNDEFQLGTGVEYSVLEVAAMFNQPIEFIPPRPGDRPRGLADIAHTKEVLGYNPKYNLKEYIDGYKFV